MPEPYASIIAILYGIGLFLLIVSLPSRLKAKLGRVGRKNAVLAAASQADASAVNQVATAHADETA
jgi:hypothetical protein